MTGELILFEGKEVRTIEQDGDVWIPLYDLSLAWGLDRTTLLKHIERNADFFDGCSRRVDILSTDDNPAETQLCVNEEGVYLLLARVSTGRVKNPTVRASIIRFRKMAPKMIQKYRKKEIIQVPASPISLIDEELDQAKHFAEKTQESTKAFQAATLKKFGYDHLAEVMDSTGLTRGEIGWYNPTRLVTLCNDPDLTAERLNYYLMNKGFQVREGFVWRLTPEGAIHGMEYPYEAPSGHRETRIRWRESILFASGLKKNPLELQTVSLPVKV